MTCVAIPAVRTSVRRAPSPRVRRSTGPAAHGPATRVETARSAVPATLASGVSVFPGLLARRLSVRWSYRATRRWVANTRQRPMEPAVPVGPARVGSAVIRLAQPRQTAAMLRVVRAHHSSGYSFSCSGRSCAVRGPKSLTPQQARQPQRVRHRVFRGTRSLPLPELLAASTSGVPSSLFALPAESTLTDAPAMQSGAK